MTLLKIFPALSLALVLSGGVQTVAAQAVAPRVSATSAATSAERSLADWLMRLHEAPRKRAYVGTLVVSSDAGALSSARVWHVCDGDQQLERVEALTGPPRSTFRRNDDVVIFLPDARVARKEKHESSGPFPNFLKTGEAAIADFYGVRRAGSARVAGLDTEVVEFVPKDKLRFGYRIWSEKKTGLVVKLQTLDATGHVLEQAAFSELQLDAPVKMEQLAQMMGHTEGYRLEELERVQTTPAAEGWSMRSQVPGFRPMSCFKRSDHEGQALGARSLQWVFSDGLATVSLFMEAVDPQRHPQEGVMALGATQMLTKQLAPSGAGNGNERWWLTAVGEVPLQTLQAFAQGLERRH